MRYPNNEDTEFYGLASFCPHIDTYEQFEMLFDKARKEPVNMQEYADYMRMHYTSSVAKQLDQIIKSL